MEDSSENTERKKKKTVESGIIYLSRVPTLMNVNIIRRYFENFGELGRVFLQPDVKAKTRGKRGRIFSEGWVEFRNKKVAKKVAASLNNEQIGGKKKNKWREELWNIKYLHRFKWAHLNERLAYEKAVHAQRMRAEISQAKREANFYIQNAERLETQRHIEKKKKRKNELKDGNSNEGEQDGQVTLTSSNERVNIVHLKETDDEITRKKRKKQSESRKNKNEKMDGPTPSSEKRKAFLAKIFSGGIDEDNNDDD